MNEMGAIEIIRMVCIGKFFLSVLKSLKKERRQAGNERGRKKERKR